MSILDEIFAHKRSEVAARQRLVPLVEMRRLAETAVPPQNFIAALRHSPAKPALIAEVKKASPSKGLLAPNFDPLALAQTYGDNGAAAISVLTDENYFQGSLTYLRQIAALPQRPPLLRKDFLYDPYQVYEARAAGADAVLLIVAHLEPAHLRDLQQLAAELGMAALVEVHTQAELDTALVCDPLLVGINNRDLHTFTVSLQTTRRLRPSIPPHITTVAESGIHSAADAAALRGMGVHAMLVGESLVTAADTGAKVRELLEIGD
ncbi:MAG: indole-3-glycerol phosphate synthase TrpC [Ardenticatenaceae bacterium]|nr:indole-3-glycerol phosphate synthase TrpC [Anaerolineales bacterium]MCB8923851.1 indole-3-glycerol phosphate synthase TrpC [Ardenticatenaceae bacterium]MCB9003370.1 indole-3-glycerol phosphate synthase TrpC [Ardenticatenaceae bacterium]